VIKNVGDGFSNTVQFLVRLQRPHLSMSDLIAAAAVTAVEAW
jgi:hypothetical protein